VLANGAFDGTPKQALDCACGLYLADPPVWVTNYRRAPLAKSAMQVAMHRTQIIAGQLLTSLGGGTRRWAVPGRRPPSGRTRRTHQPMGSYFETTVPIVRCPMPSDDPLLREALAPSSGE
jgi:hypothetical protein